MSKVNVQSEESGVIVVSNEETSITIHPDGTVAVSSRAPVQLTGACLAKLDAARLAPEEHRRVVAALLHRMSSRN